MKKTEQREMTNEEAVQVLMENYPTSNYTMLREAVDMAIKKLKEGKNDVKNLNNPKETESGTIWDFTNEEAAEIMMKNYPPKSFMKMREAVDLAIKALKNN